MELRDEFRGIVPVSRPTGAQQHHIAGANRQVRRGALEMIRSNHKVDRQDVETDQARDVEKYAAAENRLNRVDREPFDAAHVFLNAGGFLSAVQLAVAGIMAERIDVRAGVRAQGNGFGRRARAALMHLLAMLLAETVQKRRVQRKMRDPDEVRLGQIDRATAGDPGEKFIDSGQATSLLAILARRRIARLSQGLASFLARLRQIAV